MSNLHRLRGDKLALLGDSMPAARCYGRAVLHAYLFHTVGGLPPDEYTLKFYVDIRARAISYLNSLMNQGELALALACSREMWKAGPRAPPPFRVARMRSNCRSCSPMPGKGRPCHWRTFCSLGALVRGVVGLMGTSSPMPVR